MLGKKAKSRLALLLVSLLSGVVIVFIVLKSLEENLVYFFSPTEILTKTKIALNKKISY